MTEQDGSIDRYDVYCGVDVGKSEHHACALNPAGKRLHDKPLPNDEDALKEVLGKLQTRGRVLVIIDQPASIGALVIAVARVMQIDVAYLPGLAMRRIADLYPGEGKTDARDCFHQLVLAPPAVGTVVPEQVRRNTRDSFIIADAARTMPHTLRRIGTDDETVADLTVLAGHDDDLASQSTRLSNRLHDAVLHVHPALERLLGKHFDRPGVLELLVAASTPDALARLTPEAMTEIMKPRSPRLAKTLPAKIRTALDEQCVTVPGTNAFGRVISGIAAQLRDIHLERTSLGAELEARLEAHPLHEVLT